MLLNRYQWESIEIFICFSTTVMYFPNKIVPASTHDITLNVKKRIQHVEEDVGMIAIRMSSFTVKSKTNDCALQSQNRRFDGFPVCLQPNLNCTLEEGNFSIFFFSMQTRSKFNSLLKRISFYYRVYLLQIRRTKRKKIHL